MSDFDVRDLRAERDQMRGSLRAIAALADSAIKTQSKDTHDWSECMDNIKQWAESACNTPRP